VHGLCEGEVDALIGLARSVYAAGQSTVALQYAQRAEHIASENRHGLKARFLSGAPLSAQDMPIPPQDMPTRWLYPAGVA